MVVSAKYAQDLHERLSRLGFTWSVGCVRQEAERLAQPGAKPTGVVSRALDELLIQDGFKKP